MEPTERKLWVWQQRPARDAGRRIVDLIKRLIILGIGFGLLVGSVAAFPFVDALVGELLGGVLAAGVKAALMLVVVFTAVAYLTLAERRFAGLIQRRLGPNRVGWFGFLQPVADGIKFFFKEDLVQDNVHKPLFVLAPAIIFIPALVVFSVIPFGPPDAGTGVQHYQLASVNIGILLVFALASLGVYGIALGGWASFSKWSLFGGLRAGAQMISYEIALGMSVIGVLIYSGSFDLTRIVEAQGGSYFGFLPAWNVLPQTAGFVVFLVAAFAETNRLPFDLPEAEQELVGGYHTEYSSMKFALFYLGEYANMVVASALVTLLFLGGWLVPGLDLGTLPPLLAGPIGIFAFMLKMFLILFLFIWVRWTLPRFRYDQLMALGWKILLPTALGNVILTALFVAFL